VAKSKDTAFLCSRKKYRDFELKLLSGLVFNPLKSH
jgi:hypothetical protein